MDAVKRASFASKQLPCGPAPLASFEDLPSDELESPEDIGGLKDEDSTPRGGSQDDTSDVNTIVSINTPDTLNLSNVSTPQIESDFDSHCTLTPVDSKIPSGPELRTGSLSSLPKEDDMQLTKQKKGSVVSLGNCEIPDMDLDQRKSSWTDIFRNHNQNSKSNVDNIVNVEIKTKPAHKKKSKSDSSKRDHSEGKSKDKSKIFGIFKSGKKGVKTLEVASEENLRTKKDSKPTFPPLNDVVIENVVGDVNEGKENEQPPLTEIIPDEFQNDLGKSSIVNISESKFTAGSKENDIRNNLNISEKEYNIFSGQTEKSPCDNIINKDPVEKIHEDGHESSESELAFDSKEEEVSKKDDDFEKENLLAQDSSEVEDDSLIELQPKHVFLIPQSIPITSRQQRLEVTTVPIDRPRSTTPINVAPLEAFIHSTSSTFDPKVEKIKLSLPGDQFLGRMKSPKRNTAKSWADFCEEGLHSPRMQKKGDDFHMSQDLLDSRTMGFDSLGMQEKEWVVFESKTERQDTPDLFRDLPVEEATLRNTHGIPSSKDIAAQISRCSCECHSHGCENSYIKIDERFASFSGSTKADVFSDKCQCQCHEKYVHLWSPTDAPSDDLLSDICDTLKSSEFSSDFASFASGQF